MQNFTLRWQHTIEKLDWEEDYRIAGSWLYLSGARVPGSGAGMEPPPGAHYAQGVWHYRPTPDLRWTQQLLLARSEFGRDYELCIDGVCHPLSRWVPLSLGSTAVLPCPNGQTHPR